MEFGGFWLMESDQVDYATSIFSPYDFRYTCEFFLHVFKVYLSEARKHGIVIIGMDRDLGMIFFEN